MPTGRVTFPSNIPNIPNHHWAAGVAPATSIAHKGAVAGAKVLAASVVDFLTDPKLVEEAKTTFKKKTAGFQCKSFLPPEQKPPTVLNKELMDRYRPLLSKYSFRRVVIHSPNRVSGVPSPGVAGDFKMTGDN